MKVREYHRLGECDNTTSVEILLENDEGDRFSFYMSEGEPKDMIFGRNLRDAFFITEMLKAAYVAGKKGELFEYVFEELE